MSILSGFDLVLEFARPAFRRHLLDTNIGGTPLYAPFELVVPIRRHGLPTEGTAVFGIDDVALILEPGTDRVGLNCSFTQSSIDFRGVHASGLDGSVGIFFPLRIVTTATGGFLLAVVQADLTAADVTLNLSHSATASLADVVASSGVNVTAQEIEDRTVGAATSLVKRGSSPPYPQNLGFPILPNQDALIPIPKQPLLSIPHLPSLDLVQCVDSETVAVFGRLLTATPLADPSAKTTGATNGYDVALSISAEAFRRLIFCRNLALKVRNPTSATEQWLKDQVPLLPSCCGGGGPFTYHGATVRSICCFLRDGYIETEGAFEKSGTCYDAVGNFAQRTTIAIETVQKNGTQTRVIRARAEAPTHEEQVRIPWFCAPFQIGTWFLDFGGFGAISQIAGDIVDGLVNPTIDVPKPTDMPLFPLEGVTFEEVGITPEALTLRGNRLQLMAPIPGGIRELGVVGEVTSSDAVKIGNGSVPVGGKFCPPRDFTWDEFRQRQVATYEAVTRHWKGDLTYVWSLEHYRGYWGSVSDPYRLTSSVVFPEAEDSVQIPVDIHFEAPPPIGITLTDHPVTLEVIENSGANVSFRNWVHRTGRPDTPVPGSFSLTLRVKVTDAAGVSREAATSFRIQGEYVHMQDGYDDYIANCIHAAWRDASKYSYKTGPIPHDGDPGPGGLVEMIQAVYGSGSPEESELLPLLIAHGRQRYGPEFDNALLASAPEGEVIVSPATLG